MDDETEKHIRDVVRRFMIHALPVHRGKFQNSVPAEDQTDRIHKYRRGDLRRHLHNSRCYMPGKKGEADIPPEELPF